MNDVTVNVTISQAPAETLTISKVLWDVYYANEARLEAFFQSWLEYAAQTGLHVPNVVCMAFLSAVRSNRELLEFYLNVDAAAAATAKAEKGALQEKARAALDPWGRS